MKPRSDAAPLTAEHEAHCRRVAGWERFPRLRHGFFGRTGGISRAHFASFNQSERIGDTVEAVRENRRRVSEQLAPLRLVLATQVHGDRVHVVSGREHEAGEGDGLITQEANLALGILTADCVPILLLAARAGVVAAVHAGWKGTALGIGPAALCAMRDTFGVDPGEVQAALGPAIGGCCYEVGEEVVSRLAASVGGRLDEGSSCDQGHLFVDLRRINAIALQRAGVPASQISAVGPCTRCAGDEYFSHRGSGGSTGRQLSFIGWEARP